MISRDELDPEDEADVDATDEPDESAALEAAIAPPPTSPLIEQLGVTIDELRIAELAATGGPVYDLNEFESVADIDSFLDVLDSRNVRWALDRSAQLVVHVNDETKVDIAIEQAFGPDDGPELSVPTDQPMDGLELGDVNITFDASAPSVSYGVSDIEGRAVADDVILAASPIEVSSGPPIWVIGLVVTALVVLFLVFVV